MRNQVKFETYEGHSILFVDYSGLTEEDMISTLDYAAGVGIDKDNLKILADFSNTRHSKEFNRKIKLHGANYHRKGRDPKIAVLGIDSLLKRIIMNATMAVTRIKNVRLFESQDQALNWLITQT